MTTLVLAATKGLVDMSSYVESFKAIRSQMERVEMLAPVIEILAGTPKWALGLLGIYLIAYLVFGSDKQALGLVALRYAGHGSKQMFSGGKPAFYIYQPWFINTSQEKAESVSAKADFWGTYLTSIRGAFCAWAMAPERDAPQETTFTAVASTTDILPNQIPAKLNLAARLPDEVVARVFTKSSLNSPAALRQPIYALDYGLVLVRLRLIGERAKETFWLMLVNDATSPGIRALWPISAWTFRGVFYVSRKRARQVSVASSASAASVPAAATPPGGVSGEGPSEPPQTSGDAS